MHGSPGQGPVSPAANPAAAADAEQRARQELTTLRDRLGGQRLIAITAGAAIAVWLAVRRRPRR